MLSQAFKIAFNTMNHNKVDKVNVSGNTAQEHKGNCASDLSEGRNVFIFIRNIDLSF